MDSNTPRSHSWSSRLVRRAKSLGVIRGHNDGVSDAGKVRKKLSKQPPPTESSLPDDVNELGEHAAYSIFSEADTLVEGGGRDATDILHGLAMANVDSSDDAAAASQRIPDPLGPEVIALRRRRAALLASLPRELWELVATRLDAADRVHLAFANRDMFSKLGDASLRALSLPENRHEKHKVLYHWDREYPLHLLCFICGKFHMRIQAGSEKLTADYNYHPVFICPNAQRSVLPRTRLTYGRELPYAFVQLALRAARYGATYGVAANSLGRRWKDHTSGWLHQTRYQVIDGHLLLRVRSQVFAPANLAPTAVRHLLFDRQEYTPFFSVCSHWRDGVLTRVCKCVLSHIPERPQSITQDLKSGPQSALHQLRPGRPVSGPRECDFCQPGRRCPECPSEYLIKLTLAEDKQDPSEPFKFALVVTRWCDLGDGSSPYTNSEWAAINGALSGYPSFQKVGRRAMMGAFESKASGVAPGQRLLSMNPNDVKEGEAGNKWY